MRRSIHRLALHAMVVALSLAPVASRAQALGVLAGSVTDTSGGVLPGAKVTVSSASVRASTFTDAHGRFEIHVLPAGTYTVTAELIGFYTAIQDTVAIEAGRTVDVPLALRSGCSIDRGLFVDLGFTQALQNAGFIAHVRITDTDPPRACPERGMCVCTEHVANVLRVAKTADAIPPPTIRLLQLGAGRLPGELHWRGSTPYAPRQEYIAFLERDAERAYFWESHGPMYMFPVRNGRVEFTRRDSPGLSDGMPVDEFSRALRTLVARARE